MLNHICVVPMADGSPACMPGAVGISERLDVGRAAGHMGLRYTVNLRGEATRHGALEASFGSHLGNALLRCMAKRPSAPQSNRLESDCGCLQKRTTTVSHRVRG